MGRGRFWDPAGAAGGRRAPRRYPIQAAGYGNACGEFLWEAERGGGMCPADSGETGPPHLAEGGYVGLSRG